METIIRDQISFPVGRVEYLFLRPFSFTEFLLAKNEEIALEALQAIPVPDYVIQINDLLVPVEVKSGKTGRLRSLMGFIDRSPHNFAIRIYSGKLSVEKSKTLKGKDFVLLNLPFFLISKIPGYFVWMSK